MSSERMRIGEVAGRTGLSLRTVRYYEEAGLVQPSDRTPGGFRLYTEADVGRLLLVKRMRALDFSLEESQDLLAVLAGLAADPAPAGHAELVERLVAWQREVDRRCALLGEQLQVVEGLAARMGRELSARTPRALAEKPYTDTEPAVASVTELVGKGTAR